MKKSRKNAKKISKMRPKIDPKMGGQKNKLPYSIIYGRLTKKEFKKLLKRRNKN